jgi:hypothetical protein
MMPLLTAGGPIVVSPVVDAKGPMKAIATLEARLSQERLLWFMRTIVSPYMSDVIVDRFAYGGDASVGGPWPPLSAYTERLKRSLGAPADAPNERSGEMLAHLAYDHAVETWALGAELRIPDRSDAAMEKKLRTAQQGQKASDNPIGGATPPRPVLAIGEFEEAGIARLFDSYLWNGL